MSLDHTCLVQVTLQMLESGSLKLGLVSSLIRSSWSERGTCAVGLAISPT